MDDTRDKRKRDSSPVVYKDSEEESIENPGKITAAISIDDARRKIREFSRFITNTVIVDDEANTNLALSQNLLNIANEREREYLVKIRNNEETVKSLNLEVATQAATISSLRAELADVVSVLADARDGFKDPITHEIKGPHFLTTTGHVKRPVSKLISSFQV